VRKFLKPLLVGELAPEMPSLDRGKSVSGACSLGVGGDEAGTGGGGGSPRKTPHPRTRPLGLGQGSLWASPGGDGVEHLGSGRTSEPPLGARAGW
jgi:hypothetical protein